MIPLILNLTPTGMVPVRSMTPHVPLSIPEIVEDVRKCCDVGITMLHLHARNEDGTPTHRAEIYGEIIHGIREFAPDLVICVSLSGRNVQEVEKRAEPILKLDGRLKPDMGSLTLSSLNFVRQASMNSPETIQMLAKMMLERGILPELEAFDLGHVNYGRYLLDRGLLRPPLYWNLFLGNVAGAQLDLAHAGLMLRDLPKDSTWSFGGIGSAQLPANALAIAMGGGVRVGLEDSIHYDMEKQRLATNVDLVTRVKLMAETFDRTVMTSAEFRKLLGLKHGSGEYGTI